MTDTERPVDAFDLDRRARWIAPVEGDDLPARQRPVHQLGGAIDVDGDIRSAQLDVTAHGIYEAFGNGTHVGDLEPTPGGTAYRSRLQAVLPRPVSIRARWTHSMGVSGAAASAALRCAAWSGDLAWRLDGDELER